MTDRIEALLGHHARRTLSHNQLIAALTLAGVADPVAALADPTTYMPRYVTITPSPLLSPESQRRRRLALPDQLDPRWGARP